MDKEEIYRAWTPERSPWSRWVKAVLFAAMDAPLAPGAKQADPAASWPEARDTVLVIDLPGADGVAAGLAAARDGYQPVPLYNALPAPMYELLQVEDAPSPVTPAVAVEMRDIMRALQDGAGRFARIELRADAPPAFLLDARRSGDFTALQALPPWTFDNRAVCLPSDFPSGEFLLGEGLQRVLLIQPSGCRPQTDLAQVLRAWREAGLRIEVRALDDDSGAARACDLRLPGWWARVRWWLAKAGLYRNQQGAYGALVPPPGSGG